MGLIRGNAHHIFWLLRFLLNGVTVMRDEGSVLIVQSLLAECDFKVLYYQENQLSGSATNATFVKVNVQFLLTLSEADIWILKKCLKPLFVILSYCILMPDVFLLSLLYK